MPEKRTIERARRDKRAGKSVGTQAGEFIREEIHRIREGRHGVRSAKQAIAIGLSKARRAGVKLPLPKKGTVSESTRRNAKAASAAARKGPAKPSPTRSRAIVRALKKEGSVGASHLALSRHARSAARQRSAAERSASARKAARTKGHAGRVAAAQKAARRRARGS